MANQITVSTVTDNDYASTRDGDECYDVRVEVRNGDVYIDGDVTMYYDADSDVVEAAGDSLDAWMARELFEVLSAEEIEQVRQEAAERVRFHRL